MSDELKTLQKISQRLDQANIPYMVTGSLAMSFYATPRMTRDIDVVAELRKDDAARLTGLFKADFYIDTDMVQEAIRDRTLFNIIDHQTGVKVDFVVRKTEPYRRVEFERRRKISVDKMDLWLVSPEDLILSNDTIIMNDTNPQAAKIWKGWMDSKRPEERFRMACSMYDTAKKLVEASLRDRSPGLSDTQLRREVFLRFYGADFEPTMRSKILNWL